MANGKKQRFLVGGLGASALAGAYLLGSLSLAPAFAQSAPPAQPTLLQEEHPRYSGSIQVPEQPDQPGTPHQGEQQEAQALAGLATITADQANQAALAQVPGATVQNTELENEDGSLVYSVQLVDSAGKAQEVKVDAGNGTVLHTEADGADGAEAGEQHGASAVNEAED